jgi:PST family polysaccharide transporter
MTRRTTDGGARTFADTRMSLLAHGAGMLAPLLTVPFLSRVLGGSSWGEVLVVQSLAAWMILALEFGFDLSATRAAASSRDDATALREIIAGVASGRLLLLCALTVLTTIAWLIHPISGIASATLVGGAAFAAARGLNPFFYFQGTGRLRFALAVETLTKVGAAVAVFVVVHGPEDGWRVLALQAAGAILSLLILSVAVARQHPDLRLSVATGARALRASLHFFVFRLSSGLYNQANALLMSRVALPSSVAMFGGPERIVRAITNLLAPITQVFLPRISHLQARDAEAAQGEVRRLLRIIGGAGVLMGAMFGFGAAWIVPLLLGPGYEGAIPVLQILALLPPITACATVLGFFWAIPFGHERVIPRAVIVAGVVNVILIPLMVPTYGARGMAACSVLAESIVLGTLVVVYLRNAARRPARQGAAA